MPHIPVLLEKISEFLPKDGKQYIDGTVGDGGMLREIIKVNPKAKVLGIDLDQASLDKLHMQFAQEGLSQNVTLAHGNFKNIKEIAGKAGFDQISAVILDLGFSSSQLDDSNRGLSFQTNGPLDMRLDPSQKKTAKEIVNTYSESQLAEVFTKYGEEKLARKIAHEIVRDRSHAEITNTTTLFEIIKKALPKPVAYKANDFARRVFQALRIEVNDEIGNLRSVLPDILDILAPGGCMMIISFHSLEDRIVKEFMVSSARGCVCPPDFPQCVCGKNPLVKILTKKPITATDAEIATNPRSKPAKLRIAQKI